MTDTITEHEAAQRVQDNVDELAAQLPQAARLERQLTHTTACDDPDDGGPAGRVTASTMYQVHDLALEDYGRYFAELREWLRDNGFRVLTESVVESELGEARYLWVERDADGFRLALQSNESGGLFVTSSSPCVWPEGTPAGR